MLLKIYNEFRSLLATLDVMSDPELVKGVRESRNDKRLGKVYSFEEVFGEPL